MITVFVAEDESLARQALLAMFAGLADWHVIGAAADGRAALEACLARPPDVLLSDIRMPILDGLELVRELNARGHHPATAFITAYDAHAIEAFRLAALDYLLKPITDAEFARTTARLARAVHDARAGAAVRLRLDGLYASQLVIRSVGRIDVVPLAEVVLLRAEGNYVDAVTRTGSWLHRETLKSLRERLDPAEFLQVHRSVIVARRELRGLERGEVRLADGRLIPVGPSYLPAVEQALVGPR